MKYTPMMQATYQEAFGTTRDETLSDPKLDKAMSKNDFEPSPDYDYLRTLSGDLKGIKAWANLKAIRN